MILPINEYKVNSNIDEGKTTNISNVLIHGITTIPTLVYHHTLK